MEKIESVTFRKKVNAKIAQKIIVKNVLKAHVYYVRIIIA